MIITSPDPLLTELRGYPELLPGAAEVLWKQWGDELRGKPHAELAREAALRLDPTSGAGASSLNPGYQPPAGQTPFQRVLARQVAKRLIAPAAVPNLQERWPDLVGASHVTASREVVHRIIRENLANPPEPVGHPVEVSRVHATLNARFPEAMDRDQFARDYANLGAGGIEEPQRVLAIARVLATSDGAKTYGLTTPLASNDPRLTQAGGT